VAADTEAALALTAYKLMQYRTAAALAKDSYDRVRKVADQLGVEPQGFQNAQAAAAPVSPRIQNNGPLENKWFNPIRVLENPLGNLANNAAPQGRRQNNSIDKSFLKAIQ
jgi:hypothetical protein